MSEAFTVLIVDDNPSMATALDDILIAKGYQTHLANSGKGALIILREHHGISC